MKETTQGNYGSRKSAAFAAIVMSGLFALGLGLAGCAPAEDDPAPSAGNLKSGRFGTGASAYSFSIKKPAGRLARSINVADTYQVTVLVQASNGTIYQLHGLWNETEGTLSFSGSTADLGFEFTGDLEEGTAKIKQYDGTEWDVESMQILWDAATNVEGAPVAMAPGLPESWWGIYDYSSHVDNPANPYGHGNSVAVESWMTGNPGDRRGGYYMVLGPYSMDFWPNLDVLRQELVDLGWGDEADINEQLALNAKVQSAFTVLEVEKLSDTVYEVLLLLTLDSTSPYFVGLDDSSSTLVNGVRKAYRKVKMTKNGNFMTAELAPSPSWAYCFPTATEAKAAAYSTDPDPESYERLAATMVFETNW